jgi:shikimate 5-dehydrogenase
VAVHAIVRDPARADQLRATAERAEVILAVHRFGSAEAEELLDSGRDGVGNTGVGNTGSSNTGSSNMGSSNMGFRNVVLSTLPPRAADEFAGRDWPATTVVLDAVYADWPTVLARAVSQAGGKVINGVEILLYQAAEQVRLMTGHEAPLGAMRAAVGL